MTADQLAEVKILGAWPALGMHLMPICRFAICLSAYSELGSTWLGAPTKRLLQAKTGRGPHQRRERGQPRKSGRGHVPVAIIAHAMRTISPCFPSHLSENLTLSMVDYLMATAPLLANS